MYTAPMARLAQLKHDYQFMRNAKGKLVLSRMALPYRGGKFPKYFPDTKIPYNATPETCPFSIKKLSKDGKLVKDNIELFTEWESFVAVLNGWRSYKFLVSPPAGWRNRDTFIDTLGFGGNFVEVLNIVGNSAQIKTMVLGDKKKPIVPDPSRMNYKTKPTLIHKFTVITRQGKIVNPADNIDVYVPLISRTGSLWVSLERLDFNLQTLKPPAPKLAVI